MEQLETAVLTEIPLTEGRKCAFVKDDGEPCGAFAVVGSQFCFWHDPANAEAIAEASSKGGRARHGRKLEGKPYTLEGVENIVSLLEKAIGDCLALENSLARARVLATLANVALKAIEAGELTDRIAHLEVILAQAG